MPAKRWSPEQISHAAAAEFPDRLEMQVCAETIYQEIYRPASSLRCCSAIATLVERTTRFTIPVPCRTAVGRSTAEWARPDTNKMFRSIQQDQAGRTGPCAAHPLSSWPMARPSAAIPCQNPRIPDRARAHVHCGPRPDRCDDKAMILTVEQIVESGLCIGCGLCQAVAEPGAITLVFDPGRA